mmetsp:Transcript_23002/g.35476  ORF Transcript_23002/g.35476 Transcript_23002/m.35476 type:complete len:189 (+) Transcript_23002:136-702(+)
MRGISKSAFGLGVMFGIGASSVAGFNTCALSNIACISKRNIFSTTATKTTDSLHISKRFSVALSSATEATVEAPKLYDPNGKEFVEGSVVRVIKSLKAYHVPPKLFGGFDEVTKVFIPGPEVGNRGSKCLVVPVGMRGRVIRVYDVEDLGPAHPVVVIFEPGENADEGYETPLQFKMHFDTFELEVVS